MKLSALDWLALLLILVGALNWGVVGFTGLFTGEELNLVDAALEPIFEPGPQNAIEHLVYLLVGLAGVYFLYPAARLARDSRRSSR